ncbi:uncharacterized protein TOT_020001005 [Theileria orientalis strain Shintoku]|uniref:Thioredoxin domain-containing protein n=1 Tax=Theileria orientalis strain Shintoku TaxID=869250 RepID=J4C831_THEOR|nr:uncharacterized protein TOT_020001005 [Theileria orientalis strain Shintoku]PVC51103.1 hypothetical protein MACL_00001759 [Theileria orientalis]BAM40078.1 uncharacterized protein TOT_020001005 [Theileria orientalis strain Shintoku]|eukprot:XP_009690379.1 uncharacterized protein TOT_020001005 [Theileria orientalis strain Shintoku]
MATPAYLINLYILLLIRTVKSKPLVDPMQHELQVVNSKTFTTNVQLARQSNVVGALFYTSADSNASDTISELNHAAKDLKGMINIVSVNCGDHTLRSLCKSELGDDYSTPSFRVYPKIPVPPYTFQKKLLKDEVKKELLKHLPSSVEKVEAGMLAHFMTKHEVMPKVLLFSDKEHPSYIYKALSNAFHKKLLLGFIDVNKHADLKKEYKVTKVPTMLVVKPNAKPQKYTGEFKYLPMFEWLNVNAEAFLLGGGYSDKADPAKAKPWKFDKIPKLNFYSHQDICFNKSHGLCIIYLTNAELTTDERDTLLNLSEKYKGQLTGKWMWMNLGEEKEFSELFAVESLPSLVVFNPKNRLRYFLHDVKTAVTSHSIERMLEKILGGDARFTPLTGHLPKFKLDEMESEEL